MKIIQKAGTQFLWGNLEEHLLKEQIISNVKTTHPWMGGAFKYSYMYKVYSVYIGWFLGTDIFLFIILLAILIIVTNNYTQMECSIFTNRV